MSNNAPAGWYPQADGTQRYWDGNAWTNHMANADGSLIAPSSAAESSPESADSESTETAESSVPETTATTVADEAPEDPAEATTVLPVTPDPATAVLPVTPEPAVTPVAAAPVAAAAPAPASAVPAPAGVGDGTARPWWKKKWIMIPAIAFVAFFGLIVIAGIVTAATGGDSASPTPSATPSVTPSAPEPSPTAELATFMMPDLVGRNLQDAQDELQSLESYLLDQQDASGAARMQIDDSNWKVCSQEPAAGEVNTIDFLVVLASVKVDELCPGEAPAEPAAPAMTTSQQQAVRSAESYLDFTAFSNSGLIAQLEYEGFSNADAAFAVGSLSVDWNAQAAKSAQSYLDLMAFSRSGLIEQLEYEGYSHAEAEYGATAVGL